MKTSLSSCMLSIVFVSMLACGSRLAGQSLTDPNSLSFETNSEELKWNWRGYYNSQNARPTYVAVMPINESQCFQGVTENRPFFWEPFQECPLSAQQKEFLKPLGEGRGADSRSYWIIDESPGGEARRVFLYAVSEDAAKAMARAYLVFARARWSSEVQDKTQRLDGESRHLEDRKKRLAEREYVLKNAPVELEELKTKVTYHDPNQALEVVPDLDKAIHACTIEIAGIRTKLEWITKYQQQPIAASVPESARPRLDTMFIEESIALKAAEARLKTATDLRTQTQRYADLTNALRRAPGEKAAFEKEIRQAEGRIEGLQRGLSEWVAPVVPGGKAIIHKVQPTGAP